MSILVTSPGCVCPSRSGLIFVLLLNVRGTLTEYDIMCNSRKSKVLCFERRSGKTVNVELKLVDNVLPLIFLNLLYIWI